MSTTPCKKCIDFHAKNFSRLYENLSVLPCICKSCNCHIENSDKIIAIEEHKVLSERISGLHIKL